MMAISYFLIFQFEHLLLFSQCFVPTEWKWNVQQQVRGTTRCVSLHATKYTSATVFYKIHFHFDSPYTQLNATFTRTKVKDDLLGRLLKSPIFIVQKAAASKNGLEFRQKPIGVIRYCLATSYDDVKRRLKILWWYSDRLWHGPSRWIYVEISHYYNANLLYLSKSGFFNF